MEHNAAKFRDKAFPLSSAFGALPHGKVHARHAKWGRRYSAGARRPGPRAVLAARKGAYIGRRGVASWQSLASCTAPCERLVTEHFLP